MHWIHYKLMSISRERPWLIFPPLTSVQVFKFYRQLLLEGNIFHTTHTASLTSSKVTQATQCVSIDSSCHTAARKQVRAPVNGLETCSGCSPSDGLSVWWFFQLPATVQKPTFDRKPTKNHPLIAAVNEHECRRWFALTL